MSGWRAHIERGLAEGRPSHYARSRLSDVMSQENRSSKEKRKEGGANEQRPGVVQRDDKSGYQVGVAAR